LSKLLTKHEIFDHISDITEGSTIVLIDETRFESMLFLNSLLSKRKNDILIISSDPIDTSFKFHKIDFAKIQDLTSLSIEVESCKRKLGQKGIIIHNYLPHVLIRDGEESVIKMIEHWIIRKSSSGLSEFLTLPQSTFPLFEKKLKSLANGIINIELDKSGDQKFLFFSIHKSCKPEYHMEQFPFIVKGNQLLVRWGDEFADKLPKEEETDIKNKIEFLQKNVNSLKVIKSKPTRNLSPYDNWLLSQIQDRKLDDIYIFFPEKFEDILSKIARWNIRGFVKFEDFKSKPLPPIKPLSHFSKFALSLPTIISLFFLRKRSHTIPIRVYHTLRNSVESFLAEQVPEFDFNREHARALNEIEMYFQELTARMSAIQTHSELGEDARLKWDIKYLPKIITLTLYYGYKLVPKIKQISEEEYNITIKDCFICSKIKSENKPVCHLLVGTMLGSSAVVFKEKFDCYEAKCKALGDEACEFILKRI
jgi:hypothetical protein